MNTATVHNNTDLSQERIADLALIGCTVNRWRGRHVALYVHPTDPDRLISVGITFDGETVVICDEPRSDWTVALDYIAHGKVYTSN